MTATTNTSKTARAYKAAATRKANKELKARLDNIKIALTYERTRFNVALAYGTKVTLTTAFGDFTVESVDSEHWYYTKEGRSFCGSNDGKWTDLLRQAGVTRHPLFAKYS